MRLVGLVCALASIVSSARALPAQNKPIQPGARILRPDLAEPLPEPVPYKLYRCTLTFIFRDDAGALYTGTTGEQACVDHAGARVVGEDGKEFGTAVFQEYDANTPSDSFTLIAIDTARYADVDPSVRFWGGPAGIATSAAQGDPLGFTGNGEVEGDVAPQRAGALVSFGNDKFTAQTLAELGDSGAPVIDLNTKQAIGMISDFGFTDSPPATDDGPSVLRILHDLRQNGFDLQLVTS